MTSGRKLKLKARAERQAQTRQRIVEAAVALHGTVGPAHTTISAIADKAGVQRQTVYAHFPDERSLMEACSAHGRALFPPPDPRPWTQITDPSARLRAALGELYPYFRRNAAGWAIVLRDADLSPLVREMAENRRLGYLSHIRDILAAGWGLRGRRHLRLIAALGLAVDFRTWETLATKQGLDDDQAVNLIADMVECATRPPPAGNRNQNDQ